MRDQDPPGLHPLLASRWSPTTFDPEATVSAEQRATLVEAARWAPSAGNSQPWSFIVAHRGDETHARIVRHLARSSGRWAPTAGLLIVNLSHLYVDGTDLEYSEFARYDLGQAVAHLSIQARSLGLQVRQFRAFDRDAVAEEFGVSSDWEVTTMAAVGHVPLAAPDRNRRTSDEIIWP